MTSGIAKPVDQSREVLTATYLSRRERFQLERLAAASGRSISGTIRSAVLALIQAAGDIQEQGGEA